jgi:hypothetical protein
MSPILSIVIIVNIIQVIISITVESKYSSLYCPSVSDDETFNKTRTCSVLTSSDGGQCPRKAECLSSAQSNSTGAML